MTQLKITDDLDALLDVLPLDIRHAVEKANDTENLLEIILDLGRVPTARFVDHEIGLRETEVTRAEIDYVDERTGEFDADNRAGIERTLHRISAIRNRRTAVGWPDSARGTRGLWHRGYHPGYYRIGQVSADPWTAGRGQDHAFT
jgi:stage III sporulation protein SpoIIIAA